MLLDNLAYPKLLSLIQNGSRLTYYLRLSPSLKRRKRVNFSVKTIFYILGFMLASYILYAVTMHKMNLLKDYNTDIEQVTNVKEIERKLDCMAINIYREAGHEPFEGKVAVAQVTMNRVEHPDFPKDVCGVVYQKNNFMGKVVCQFSWFCDSTHRNRVVNPKAYEESYEVAKKVMLEGFRLPSLNDALYYHADYVNPNWKHERVAKIGVHIFYRSKNRG